MATQAEKSAAMRQRLLDATIDCLVERGYRATSTPEICRRAGVSRGGQLHHYATKDELVAAAVEHLFSRRLAEMEDRLLSSPSGILDLRDAASHLLTVYTGETFYAWLELLVAARTEPTLRALLAALDARFVAAAERLCRQFLLPAAPDSEVQSMTRLVLAIFDGLATHRILTDDDTVARRALATAAKAGLFSPSGGRA
jgi:AcrR family transcriptional regulator